MPREYKSITSSFLRELPLPNSLPKGLFIILGSQSFELEDIPQEIKTEFQNGSRTIPIDPLKKEEVYTFIDSLQVSPTITGPQKLKIFEKSQGHPLYLSYLIEKINGAKSTDNAIDSFDIIEGDIDNYYKKIWIPIQKEGSLISLLGLIARINGSIKQEFIQEWGFEPSTLKLFKENAKILFNKAEGVLSFFHNSYRQFLIHYTSINYLTDDFDFEANIKYHVKLADLYKHSKIENSWQRNYHLFVAKCYNDFILEASPNSFTFQLISYRPDAEIKQDIKLGIRIALQKKDINILIRYLFSLAEIELRLNNIDPGSFTEQLLLLNKSDVASRYLRSGNTLHCNTPYALKASRLFIEYGHISEGEILFNLSYPDCITEYEINIDDSYRYEEIKKTLEEWVYTSPYFEPLEKSFKIIENITFSFNINNNISQETERDLYKRLLIELGYSLTNQNKWEGFDQVVEKLIQNSSKETFQFFLLIQNAIEHCISIQDNGRTIEYLTLLTTHFSKDKATQYAKIQISDLVYKATQNIDEAFDWVKDVEQPSHVGKKHQFGYDDSLDEFGPLIKLNKILNLYQKGVPVTSAIPKVKKGTEDEVLAEFERMLCLITQILSDGILGSPMSGDITKRVQPIVQFYYKNISHKNNYGFKIAQAKGEYFNFLIYAVSTLNTRNLETLGEYLFSEFFESPNYWSPSVQREIVKALLSNGFDPKKAKMHLKKLEESMLHGLDISSRINECLAHSKVWFMLSDLEEGEKWLKQSIRESLGIGYRKDYQFSIWIDWLRKINLKNSSNAPQRIKWFLSHLRYIKETTEGRAYWNASEELLEATHEYCLSDGLAQIIWQLNHDLIDFKDSMSVFIEFYVKQTKNEDELKSIIQLYNNLYLILSESADTSLLNLILKKGYEISEERFLKKYIPSIISSIKIRAYEESRIELLSEIKSCFLLKGIKLEDYFSDFVILPKNERNSSSSSSNGLRLKNHPEIIYENEVLEKIRGFNDFKKLIEEEDKSNSYFDWSRIVQKISPLLSLDQIEEVASLARVDRKESDFYANLSESALKLGDKDLAKRLANKSLELSNEYGWGKIFDGGTRIIAFNALKKIDPVFSSDKAFEIFSHDIISKNHVNSYVEYLEDIIPLLSESYNEEEIWPEVFEYLQRLMSNSTPITDLPVISSVNQQILETLVDYLVFLSKSPITFIKEQSIILLAHFIHQDNAYALVQLQNDNIDDYITMDIIMALSELKSSKIYNIKSKIQRLSLSRDFQLRENSKQILLLIGEDIPIPQSIKLPSIYSLQIPEVNKPEFYKEVDPYFPEVNIDDPGDMIRPFEFLLNILAKVSGIKKPNLIYRAYSIMKEIGKKEEWSVEYEKQLRNHLEEVYLKYSYPRPRIIAARRAIMHVACELIDSETIAGNRIQDIFKSHDYASPHFNESAKPLFIQPIKERDFGGVENNWLDRITESPKLTESLLDYGENFKVIAQYSQVKNLDWDSPTEEYMSQIAINDEVNEDEEYLFGSVFQQLTTDYHDLEVGGHFIIVIRDHRFDQFDLKSKWIAINPSLARYLGWKPEPTKLFAWKDAQEELMVESLYWLNGNMQFTPRKDGEVGEGWFVIISEKALEQIKAVENSLFLQKKLVRSKSEDSVLLSKNVTNVTRI